MLGIYIPTKVGKSRKHATISGRSWQRHPIPLHSDLLAPLVLLANLCLLLRGEVVYDVERFSDLLWRLAFDHRRYLGAGDVKQGLDVQIVRNKHQVEQRLLLLVHEFDVTI